MATHTIFICGATGLQGGALARQLRALNWTVHTTARDPSSPAATALTSLGVHVHAGSWNDTAVLTTALTGCDLLFLNLVPDITNPDAERQDGETILAAATAAGVQHVVYSSGIDMPVLKRDPSHFLSVVFRSKLELERGLQAGDSVPFIFPRWTILRPGFFMSNFLAPRVNMLYPGSTQSGAFTVGFRPTSGLPMIDHEDIARFAVAAFQDPDRFQGRVVDVISQTVTFERAMKIIGGAAGREIKVEYLTDEQIKEGIPTNPLLAMQEELRDVRPLGDKDAKEVAKGWGVEVGTFEQFAEREKAAFEETYQAA
ncbi:uncharacterized protein C8A04DRAFT_37694 [Dichotomopilus funicola]|uniref:NmrA-like domain-containing protein n=1 Tax=Dichotomopilus funicola TaxID=1934379 RepID=A0AAN6V1M1_9PEZI|nr:hypothetical protein C8A04DRAFT_37694 [Dichotomopilus funicola]